METEELYLGIDINEEISQVCFFDAGTNSVVPVYNGNEMALFENAKLLSTVIEGEKPEEKIAKMLGALIAAACNQSRIEKVKSVCVCIHEYEAYVRELFHKAFDILGFKRSDYILIGEEEAFAYYSFSAQTANTQGVGLYNYTSQRGIRACFLTKINYKGTTILRQVDDNLTDDDVIVVASKKMSIHTIRKKLVDYFEKTLSENRVSSVFLTGDGFNEEDIPSELIESINQRGVRVFLGQNLYVKGACICATAKVIPMADPFKKIGTHATVSFSGKGISPVRKHSFCVMACKNRITAGISVKEYYFGQTRWKQIISPGSNTDESETEFECLLTDEKSIKLEITPLGTAGWIENIDLFGFPDREPKTTFVNVRFRFPDEDTLVITAVDKGFGEIYKAGGMIDEVTVDLKGYQTGDRGQKSKGVILNDIKKDVTAFVFPSTGMNLYTPQELVYYLYNNIYLVKKEFLGDDLIRFLGMEYGMEDLTKKISDMIKNEVPFESILITLFKEINYFNERDIKIMETILKSFETAGQSSRKYSMAMTYLKNNCVTIALNIFKDLAEKPLDKDMPDNFPANVIHNMGVCYARLNQYEHAAECFEEAYRRGENSTSRNAAITARRMSGTTPTIMYTNKELEEVDTGIEKLKKIAKAQIMDESVSTKERLEKKCEEYIISHDYIL